MKRYLVELVLGVVFLAVFFVSSGKFGPRPKMTKDEVAGYVAKIEQGVQMPEPMRNEFIARVRAWGEADDGEPVYLAEIFHNNDAAEMSKAIWPGLGIETAADGEKTHQIYLDAVKPLILPKGALPAIIASAQGVGVSNKTNLVGFFPGFDEWSEIDIIRFPGRRDILELFSDPTYLKVMPYKLVGLRLLAVPTSLRFQLPDPRLAIGGVLLVIFLTVGWLRAALRAAPGRRPKL